ncbi:MAG: phospho-N-acetylmuramoyl-pentapeptide-transferase, partial [Rhodospirillales bacterium]|nr:phospho-N-acetylmuramoyl-pentapeptide-transferase [Rhodospirillales bacterium]
MLPYFLVPLADDFAALNVFRYLTFRTGGAVITALIVA